MTFQIGPVSIPYFESVNWSSRLVSATTAIPYGRVQNSIIGAEMLALDVSGLILADTVLGAKILRIQLADLFGNKDLGAVYVNFNDFDTELSGWYLLESVDLEVEAHIFGTYPFSMTMKRLASSGGVNEALYWHSTWITGPHNTFSPPKTWAAMPNGRGDSSWELRVAENGSNRIIQEGTENIIPYNHLGNPNIHMARCRIYDTRSATFSHGTQLDESNWIERYSSGIHFEGDCVVGNGIIRYVLINNQPAIHVWTGLHWTKTISAPVFDFTGSLPNLEPFGKLTIEYFDWDKIVFHQMYVDKIYSHGQASMSVRYTLYKGSYFFGMELVSRHAGIDGANTILTTGSTGASFVAFTPYSDFTILEVAEPPAVDSIDYACGFLYGSKNSVGTSIASPPGVRLGSGHGTSANERIDLGFFVAIKPLTLSQFDIPRQYRSGTVPKRVLIDPVWLNT